MVREDQAVIREKAIRIAVRTGWAPDVDFVWTAQEHDGSGICFGSYRPGCSRKCRWLERCRVLSGEPIDSPWPEHYHAADFGADNSAPPPDDRWLPPSLRRDTSTTRRRAPI